MRLRNRVGAIMAAISLLALAPAGASALKHPSPNGKCNININAAPRLLEAGESVTVFGHLSCLAHSAAAGRPVTLLQRVIGTPGFKIVQTTMTDGLGFYELTLPNVVSNSVFLVRSHGAASGRTPVRVFAHVIFSGPPEGTQLLTGPAHKVTFSGSVSPNDAGALVVLQRQNALKGNGWHRIQRGIIGPTGAYSIVHTFVVPGDANLRVVVRSQGRNVPSPSDLLTYEISQAENPALTISSIPNPISYGQSTVISGVVAGVGAGTPVTLLAHTAHQHGFAPVTEVKTDGSGDYTFPAQSPVASTFYQAKADGKFSAISYEGVRDVVTAVASPTTVPAGTPFTVKGTVGPDHTGDQVYLQQQNHSGGGFHTVQVATIEAGSVYSIAHSLYTPGATVFRVKVPGSPQDEGGISPAFTIVVTPLPPAALPPEAFGNVNLPPEGQV